MPDDAESIAQEVYSLLHEARPEANDVSLTKAAHLAPRSASAVRADFECKEAAGLRVTQRRHLQNAMASSCLHRAALEITPSPRAREAVPKAPMVEIPM